MGRTLYLMRICHMTLGMFFLLFLFTADVYSQPNPPATPGVPPPSASTSVAAPQTPASTVSPDTSVHGQNSLLQLQRSSRKAETDLQICKQSIQGCQIRLEEYRNSCLRDIEHLSQQYSKLIEEIHKNPGISFSTLIITSAFTFLLAVFGPRALPPLRDFFKSSEGSSPTDSRN